MRKDLERIKSFVVEKNLCKSSFCLFKHIIKHGGAWKGRKKAWKPWGGGGARSNVVGIICPPGLDSMNWST